MFSVKALFARKPTGEHPYTVYTRDYDLVVAAADLHARLADASPDRAEWRDTDGSKWQRAQEIAARFAAAQPPITDAVAANLRGEPHGLVVSLLIDQSGSMRGEPIAAVAAAIRAFETALEHLGVGVEILGFSTAGWHGGFARKDWLAARRPRLPGRLCALLHIIYKSAEQAEWDARSRTAMLHPDILRENIDGEALDWAASRLNALSASRKMLIVLSDGAPVDDSTLSENGPAYLERDILRAIAAIENSGTITLGGLGVGYAMDRYYRNSRASSVPTLLEDLVALFGELNRLADERPYGVKP